MHMARAAKSKAAKIADKAAETTIDAAATVAADAPNAAFAYSNFEVPEIVRSFTEQGMKQTREVYARAKSAAEEATELLEDSIETSRESVREAQFKALDMAKANADATFELTRRLLAAKSFPDALQLQTAFARERFEAFVSYSKDMQELMGKAGAEAGKPAKAMFEKTFAAAKAAA
jgi:phasin